MKEKEREREREKHQFVVALIYAFIRCFLYVPWTRIVQTAYQDNVLSNWATQLGPTLATSESFTIEWKKMRMIRDWEIRMATRKYTIAIDEAKWDIRALLHFFFLFLFFSFLFFWCLNILFFLINLFIFIQLQLSAFSPLSSTPPQPYFT